MKILIVRLSALGDVLRSLPAIKALKDKHPDWIFDFMVEDKATAPLPFVPWINKIHVLPRKISNNKGHFAYLKAVNIIIKDIKNESYDLALDMHGIAKSALILKWTGIKTRIGFAPPSSKEMAHWFYTKTIKGLKKENRYQRAFRLCQVLDNQIELPSNIQWSFPQATEEIIDSLKKNIKSTEQ